MASRPATLRDTEALAGRAHGRPPTDARGSIHASTMPDGLRVASTIQICRKPASTRRRASTEDADRRSGGRDRQSAIARSTKQIDAQAATVPVAERDRYISALPASGGPPSR
ncbi:MAG: hypothetical protein MZV65_13250 [Chromatiales bacterium]|nr:hypothetical protein [Chromatiales bacterium]